MQNPFELILDKLKNIELVLENIKPINEVGKSEEISNGYIDLAAASRFLEMAPSSIHLYRKKYQLPCTKIGRRLKFIKSDLSKWLDEFNKSTIQNTGVESMMALRNRYSKK